MFHHSWAETLYSSASFFCVVSEHPFPHVNVVWTCSVLVIIQHCLSLHFSLIFSWANFIIDRQFLLWIIKWYKMVVFRFHQFSPHSLDGLVFWGRVFYHETELSGFEILFLLETRMGRSKAIAGWAEERMWSKEHRDQRESVRRVLIWRRTRDVLSQEEDVVAIRVWLQGGWNCATAPQHSTKREWNSSGNTLRCTSKLCLIRAPDQTHWSVKLIRSQICSSTHFTTYPSLTKPNLCVKPFIESTLSDTQTSQPHGFLLAVQLEKCRNMKCSTFWSKQVHLWEPCCQSLLNSELRPSLSMHTCSGSNPVVRNAWNPYPI